MKDTVGQFVGDVFHASEAIHASDASIEVHVHSKGKFKDNLYIHRDLLENRKKSAKQSVLKYLKVPVNSMLELHFKT